MPSAKPVYHNDRPSQVLPPENNILLIRSGKTFLIVLLRFFRLSRTRIPVMQ